MQLGRVVGTVVSTVKEPRMKELKLQVLRLRWSRCSQRSPVRWTIMPSPPTAQKSSRPEPQSAA